MSGGGSRVVVWQGIAAVATALLVLSHFSPQSQPTAQRPVTAHAGVVDSSSTATVRTGSTVREWLNTVGADAAARGRGQAGDSTRLSDEANVRVPRDVTGQALTMAERVRLLELKVGGFMNWAKDPWFGQRTPASSACKVSSDLKEFGCPPGSKCSGLYSHFICLDHLPPPVPYGQKSKLNPECIIYDFGIREQPEFGLVLAENFGCTVHGFDPSPVTKRWLTQNTTALAKRLHELPNYHMHFFGGGGINGEADLGSYDWGQVSILRFPTSWVNCTESRLRYAQNVAQGLTPDPFTYHCKVEWEAHGTVRLPVRTLGSVMKELGHTRIDVLKIDIEGSEYAFLEEALDTSALNEVGQVPLEWHHFSTDPRYGAGSSRAINALSTVLSAVGLEMYWIERFAGWPTNVYEFERRGVIAWYNCASYLRRDWTSKWSA